jgi:ketosteroid isomerase-like protein
MAGQNVDMVRRATEAYNRGDIDGTLESWADDAVLDWSRSRGPDAAVYRGREEIRRFTAQFLDLFDVRTEIVELRELSEGLVLFDNLAHLTGRDGIETEARSTWLISIENGKQAHVTMYQSKREALEAAGLSE